LNKYEAQQGNDQCVKDSGSLIKWCLRAWELLSNAPRRNLVASFDPSTHARWDFLNQNTASITKALNVKFLLSRVLPLHRKIDTLA